MSDPAMCQIRALWLVPERSEAKSMDCLGLAMAGSFGF